MATAPRPEPAMPPAAAAAADPAPAPASTTLSVRFVRTFRQYQRGDRCGFPVNYAEQLIRKGVAVLDGVSGKAFDAAASASVNSMIRK